LCKPVLKYYFKYFISISLVQQEETIMSESVKIGGIGKNPAIDKMDKKFHFRVFQNENASYGDIIKKIASTYDKGKAVHAIDDFLQTWRTYYSSCVWAGGI